MQMERGRLRVMKHHKEKDYKTEGTKRNQKSNSFFFIFSRVFKRYWEVTLFGVDLREREGEGEGKGKERKKEGDSNSRERISLIHFSYFSESNLFFQS